MLIFAAGMYFLIILIVFIIATIFVLLVVECSPNWSPTYTVKGTLYIPYAELKEPFYAWYDETSGQSRIDYYGGMVKTYQLSGSGKYGTSLKIAPITTEQELNALKCLQVNGTFDAKITPQSILPSLVGFECIGNLKMYIFIFIEIHYGEIPMFRFRGY